MLDCEKALELMSAQIDRELGADDAARLTTHLADCPSCRATKEALIMQDAHLRQAFEPRQEAAAANASVVIDRLPQEKKTVVPSPQVAWMRVAVVLGMAAAILVAVMIWSRAPTRPGAPRGNERADTTPLDPRRRLQAEFLTARQRPDEIRPRELAVGAEEATGAGERSAFASRWLGALRRSANQSSCRRRTTNRCGVRKCLCGSLAA